MLIQEQFHKNLYRSYFRGYLDGYDKEKAIFKNFSYYTTSPLYALYYAKKYNNWTVSEYKLKDQVNIFNARSKKDFFALHKYLIDNNEHYFISKIEDLKYRDWSGLFGDEKREELLNIIKHLGYDGFFNFEYDIIFKHMLTEKYNVTYLPVMDSNPAIGVLNSNIFIKINDFHSVEDMKNLEQIKKYKNSELENIKAGFIWAKKCFGKETACVAAVSNAADYFIITKDDILDMIEDIDEDEKEYEKSLELLKHINRPGIKEALDFEERLRQNPDMIFENPPFDFEKLKYWIYARKIKDAQKK